MLTCLAVDDEPLALRVVSRHIERTPFLTLAGAFTNALEALDTLRRTPVDLLLLDIQMPDLSGLELARVLAGQVGGGAPRTRVVFTTAFSEFALDGYRLDALDYLLKPIEYADFLRVALKAQAYFDAIRSPAPALLPVAPPAPEPDGMVLKVDYQLMRVRFADILYIEGLKDYVRIHRTGPEPWALLTLSSLRAIEEKLPAGRFLRLHRSFIVNLDRVEAVGRAEVRVGSVTVPVGNQYREGFDEFVRHWS